VKRLVVIAVLALGVCWGTSFAVHARAQTKPEAAPVARFETDQSLADNLKLYTGKDVYVHLRSGKTVQGYVKSVGSHLLHLEKLSGRDFYDALVRIEDISAFEARFRGVK
jgi:hypothetical protein